MSAASLGREIVNPAYERQARAKAFLNIPLYKVIYDDYRGHPLPPNVGLERVMQDKGVSPKLTDKARLAFQKSAEQASYFEQGRDRLILPTGISTRDIEAKSASDFRDHQDQHEDESIDYKYRGRGGGDEPPALHPFIQGLLQTLPRAGTPWPKQKQNRWLETAKNVFGLIYPSEDDAGNDSA